MTRALDIALTDLADMTPQEVAAGMISLIAADIVSHWAVHRTPVTPEELVRSVENLGLTRDDVLRHWPKAYTVALLAANLADLRIPKQEPKYDA